MLVATFIIILPRIRRRQRLVDIREAASTRLAGHVADSISNAEAVRAFAREPEEGQIHERNVKDFGSKTLRSWDYQNLRVDTITSPMSVLTRVIPVVGGRRLIPAEWRHFRHRGLSQRKRFCSARDGANLADFAGIVTCRLEDLNARPIFRHGTFSDV